MLCLLAHSLPAYGSGFPLDSRHTPPHPWSNNNAVLIKAWLFWDEAGGTKLGTVVYVSYTETLMKNDLQD